MQIILPVIAKSSATKQSQKTSIIFSTSSARSFQSGFILLIKSSFFCLEPAFICFSLPIASPIYFLKGFPIHKYIQIIS